MMLSTAITTLLHIFVRWIMVFKSGLGSIGATFANAVVLWINVLLLVVYVRVSPSYKRIGTVSQKRLLVTLLAVPSAVMVW